MKAKKVVNIPLIAMLVLSMGFVGVASAQVWEPPYPDTWLWASDYIVETRDNLTGTRFNITVSVYNVTRLGSFEFYLGYNNTLLEAVSCSLTPIIDEYFDYLIPSPWTPTAGIFHTAGYVYFGSGGLKDMDNPFTGSGALLVIEFEISVAPPREAAPPEFINYTCPLDLYDTLLTGIDLEYNPYTIEHSVDDGEYLYAREQIIPGVPTADFTWSPLYPSECDTVTLTDASDPGEEAYLVSWSWAVANVSGEAVLTGSATTNVTTMHAVKAGIVSVTLTVTNNFDNSHAVTKDIEILAVAGAIIDLYTSPNRFCGQVTDYIGEGPGVECDALSPDVNVTLYAEVTWNGAPVMHVMVPFEIRWMQYIEWEIPGFEPVPKDEFVLSRTAETDEDGIARTWFRVPIPSSGPQMFGKWLAIATCKVQEEQIGDTMPFDVGHLITILEGGVFTTEPEYVRNVDVMTIHIKGKNIAWMDKSVTFVVTVYDDGDVPIGQKIADVTISKGAFCSPLSFEIILYDAIHVPQHAYVGIGKVYVSAFTALPSECGVPYCPEKSDTFLIKF